MTERTTSKSIQKRADGTKPLFRNLPSVACLLPHEAPMVMVDRLIAVSESGATCEADIHSDHLYIQPQHQSVPAWVGIEMIAQTAAAQAGYYGWLNDTPPRAGMLLGTRKFTAHCDQFAVGSTLQITIVLDAEMGEMKRIKGKVTCDGKLAVECDINLFVADTTVEDTL